MAAATRNMSRVPAMRRRACGADARGTHGMRAALCLNRPDRPDTLLAKSSGRDMKQIRIGDITIDAVIEREGPWRRPPAFSPACAGGASGHRPPTGDPDISGARSGWILI